MKTIFSLMMLALFSNHLSAQNISAADASKHIGEKGTVCGKVFGGRYFETANRQPALLNVGAAYPDNPFTFVIFGEDRKNFSYSPEVFLVNKEVCVSGQIIDYKSKPEIVVTDSAQIRIL